MDREEKLPSSKTITRRPFANSSKVYVPGKIHDIKVGMREVSVDDKAIKGPGNSGSVVTIYDTSGPYSDSEQPANSRARMRMAAVRGLMSGCLGVHTVLKRFNGCD